MTDPLDTAAIQAHCCACDRACGHIATRRWCTAHSAADVTTALTALGVSPDAPVASLDDWKAAYWRMQQQFAAETLKTSELTAKVDRLRARIAELEAEQQNGEWQYGFVNPNTGEFIHHGDENQARALATIVKRPIMRRHARYGPVTPITDTAGDQE